MASNEAVSTTVAMKMVRGIFCSPFQIERAPLRSRSVAISGLRPIVSRTGNKKATIAGGCGVDWAEFMISMVEPLLDAGTETGQY